MGIEIFFIFILFEITEHGAVVHMVTKNNVIRIAQVFRVIRLKIDRTGNTCLTEDILGSVFQVIAALYDRIVNIGVID